MATARENWGHENWGQVLNCEFRRQAGRADRWPKTYNSKPDPPIVGECRTKRHREHQAVVRSPQDANIESREARSRLAPRQDPYWRLLDKGCHLGYYKGEELRIWIARLSRGKGRDREERVGLADDFAEADGIAIMDFEQARAAARNWFAEQAIKEAALPIDDSPFNIVGPPCNRD